MDLIILFIILCISSGIIFIFWRKHFEHYTYYRNCKPIPSSCGPQPCLPVPPPGPEPPGPEPPGPYPSPPNPKPPVPAIPAHLTKDIINQWLKTLPIQLSEMCIDYVIDFILQHWDTSMFSQVSNMPKDSQMFIINALIKNNLNCCLI